MAHAFLWLVCRKHQQYDCKWYIPLADLVFPSPEESEASPHVHPFPDHELEDMKMKISALKSEIQKEVSRAWHLSWDREVGCFLLGPFELGVSERWRSWEPDKEGRCKSGRLRAYTCLGKDFDCGRWRVRKGVSAQNLVGLIMGNSLENSICPTLQKREARKEGLLKEKWDMSKRKDLGGLSETDRSNGQIIKDRGTLNMTINTLDLKMHRSLCLERELRFLSN